MSRAVVALGANLGEREETLRRALAALGSLPGTAVLRVSPLYETEPVGYLEQPSFFNAAAELETGLSPRALLGACLGIEAGLGRRRSFANAPRPVDLDVLLMEGIVSSDAELILPHPRMGERGFVLIPLRELYPDGCPLGFDFRREMAAASAEGVSYYKGTGWWNPPA